jgi:MFS family permease
MTAPAMTPGAPAAPADRDAPRPGARAALLLLLAINLFNYIDRQVLAAVEPEIEKFFFPEGHDYSGTVLGGLSQGTWMGLLSTAFLISYMLTAPVFGWLADHMSRWSLVGFGVGIWSIASAASGLPWPAAAATAFVLLIATRAFVGVGEAAYGPVAPTVIADLYPVKRRGSVLAWFYAAIPVGGALGYAWGDLVQHKLQGLGGLDGWRWAFFLVMPPGLLLGLLCFRMPDPPRGQADAVGAPPRKAQLRDYLDLLRIPSYVINTLGMTAMTFAIGGLAYWMPDYLKERGVPDIPYLGGFGRPRVFFGALSALGGLLATLLGGWAGDKLRGRFSGSYFLVSGFAMLFGFPAILLMLQTPFPLAWVWVFAAVFCLFFNTGPTNTILANVTHPSVRASGFALNILVIHALGDAISPPVMGWVRDHYDWDRSFIVVSAMMLVGAVLWLCGTGFLRRDTELAPRRLDGEAPGAGTGGRL